MSDLPESFSEKECQYALGIRYKLEAFAEDLQAVGRLTHQQDSNEDSRRLVLDYFSGRYSDENSEDNMMRCLAAASYWEKNRHQLDAGTVSVDGKISSLISPGLVWALWIGFTPSEVDWKTYNPPINAIISVAESFNKGKA
jgi:hypothetical protein